MSHLLSWSGCLPPPGIRRACGQNISPGAGGQAAHFKQKRHGPSCSRSRQRQAVGTGLGLRSGKGNVACAKSTRSHPEVWQRVTWSRKSRWGASSPCAATRKGPATTLPARNLPRTPLSRSLPLPSCAQRPFPRSATGLARATPSASGAKGSFQKYLQISTSGCQCHTKSGNIYRGMRTKAGVLPPFRTTFHGPPRARFPGV